jgi:predicted nucleic acid-binding protein
LRPPIFVDASAWLASVNDRDQHHAQARSVLTDCFAQCVQLVTTNWTAFEALSMVKSRSGIEVAADLWDLLTDPLSVDLIRVTEDIENRALGLFFAYQDKTWGVVDYASLIVMEIVGCRQALGFDHHFLEASRQRGFELLPGDSE